MRSNLKRIPRVGVVGLAFTGYNLGKEMCGAKLQQMLDLLRQEPLEVVAPDKPVLNVAEATYNLSRYFEFCNNQRLHQALGYPHPSRGVRRGRWHSGRPPGSLRSNGFNIR